MGYFSNGSEGADWEVDNCNKCAHEGPADGPGCNVLLIHSVYNYKQKEGSDLEAAMNLLIPRTENGLFNKKCGMFIEARGDRPEACCHNYVIGLDPRWEKCTVPSCGDIRMRDAGGDQ